MKQVNRLKDMVFVVNTTEYSLAGLSTPYTSLKNTYGSNVIPEGGVKILPITPPIVLNSNLASTSLTGATMALLQTAYSDWRTANPNAIVISKVFSIDTTSGAVAFYFSIDYVTGQGQFEAPYFSMVAEIYSNPEILQNK